MPARPPGSSARADARDSLRTAVTACSGEAAAANADLQRLLAQEAALANDVSTEQARWSDLNQRLEDLERSLRPVKVRTCHEVSVTYARLLLLGRSRCCSRKRPRPARRTPRPGHRLAAVPRHPRRRRRRTASRAGDLGRRQEPGGALEDADPRPRPLQPGRLGRRRLSSRRRSAARRTRASRSATTATSTP